MAQQGQAPLQGPQILWQAQPPALAQRHLRPRALQRRQRAQAQYHPYCHRENQ